MVGLGGREAGDAGTWEDEAGDCLGLGSRWD